MTPETRICCGTFMLRTGNRFECINCQNIEWNVAPSAYSEAKVNEGTTAVNNWLGEQLAKETSFLHQQFVGTVPKPKVLCVIPARIESTRLPRKVLLSETGKPLIQYAWEAAKAASLVDDVVIATDSEDVLGVAWAFGADAEATGPANSGTDRVASLLGWLESDAEIVVNLQADEPDITGGDIDQLVRGLIERPEADMATMAWKEVDEPDIADDTNNVKAVTDPANRAIYFSRSRIPQTSPWWIHSGIYAYRREFLLKFAQAPQSPLEISERLEQLRALEMGAWIHVERLSHPTRGIDTRADYDEFVRSRLAAEKIPQEKP
jgi:3-deoxy-manno-octulosonate cytidylyltransferase (CMP-KDO synthetase)